MIPTIRAASLRGFAPLVIELGGAPEDYFVRFAITAAAVAAIDEPVSITAHDLMLEAAADELGCPDLGLRLAEKQGVDVLGPLAMAIQASSTLRSALQSVSRFLFIHSPALHIAMSADPSGRSEVVAIEYRKDLRESTYSRQGIELGVGLMFRIAELLLGDTRGVRSVDFPHAPVSPIARYTGFFHSDVRFNRPAPAIRVDRALLDRPLANGNEPIRRLATDYLATAFPNRPENAVSSRVRLVLSESLEAGPGIDRVAALLVLHPRTLQRRLAAEGTSFQEIRDAVRKDTVLRLATTTGASCDEIARSVGFSEQSALSHAVRRWFGVSPRQLRRRGHPGLSR